jgi:hypothetical protein
MSPGLGFRASQQVELRLDLKLKQRERMFKQQLSLIRFFRKEVSINGPQTDELVRTGKIVTPYPKTICARHFPLYPRDERVLAVIVPNIEDIENEGLCRPTFEQAIRFASQLVPGDGHERRTLVFPSDPPFSGDVLPAIPCWLTLAWRPKRRLSELCLYFTERAGWPEDFAVVGFAPM